MKTESRMGWMGRMGVMGLVRVACCVLGLCLTAEASTMNFAITNSDTTAYSGSLMVYPIKWGSDLAPILADGSFFISGVPQRVEITNALGSAQVMRGPYFASNSVVAFCFTCPLDTGTYSAASNLISGYNIFQYAPGVSASTVSNMVSAIVGEGGGGGTNAGPAGSAATISIGAVTTLPAGSEATVENVGTSNAAVLVFGLPAGPAKAAPTIRWIAALDASVMLAWDAEGVTNMIITNYFIYWGVSSRTYTNHVATGTNLSVTVSNLVPGATYYFAATAVNSDGSESDFSDDVSVLLLPGGGSQVWTNDGTFIWPAGQPAPLDSDGNPNSPGPSISIMLANGWMTIGSHNPDGPLPGEPGTPYVVSVTDSNDPPYIGFHYKVGDSGGTVSSDSFMQIYSGQDGYSAQSLLALHSLNPTNENFLNLVTDAEDGNSNGISDGPIQFYHSIGDRREFLVDWSGRAKAVALIISGTTNQITFGATNSSPVDATNAVTVGVSVAGDTNAYYLKLYR